MGAERSGWIWPGLAWSCLSPLERAASQSRHCDRSTFWLLSTLLRHSGQATEWQVLAETRMCQRKRSTSANGNGR